MYFKYIPVAALTSDLAGVFCQPSRMAMQSSVRLASNPPREFFKQLLNLASLGFLLDDAKTRQIVIETFFLQPVGDQQIALPIQLSQQAAMRGEGARLHQQLRLAG